MNSSNLTYDILIRSIFFFKVSSDFLFFKSNVWLINESHALFLLGFLHVDPVRQADDQSGD